MSTFPFCPPGSAPPPPGAPVLSTFVGDAIVLPLVWWQTQPVYGTNGAITTPGVPVNMTGMVPSAEFLTTSAATGTPLAVTNFVPLAGSFTVVVPGRGQVGDQTSMLTPGPAKLIGPRVRVHYTDAAGNPQTFGTFYYAVN